MSYYTFFHAKALAGSQEARKKALAELAGIKDFGDICFDEDIPDLQFSCNRLDINDIGKFVKPISEKYPKVLIQIYASGEDDDDKQKVRYLAGKSEYSQMSLRWTPFKEILTREEKKDSGLREPTAWAVIGDYIVDGDDAEMVIHLLTIEEQKAKETFKRILKDLKKDLNPNWVTDGNEESYFEASENGSFLMSHIVLSIREVPLC